MRYYNAQAARIWLQLQIAEMYAEELPDAIAKQMLQYMRDWPQTRILTSGLSRTYRKYDFCEPDLQKIVANWKTEYRYIAYHFPHCYLYCPRKEKCKSLEDWDKKYGYKEGASIDNK